MRAVTFRCVRALLVGVAAFSLAGHGPAVADQGVSINLGSIQVDEALERGGSYRFPVMEVTNPGTEASAYRMSARPVSGQDELPLVGDWFVMTPDELTLQAGMTSPVTIMLTIPVDAEAGTYAGLIGPSLVSETEGASAAAGVAAKVSFEVLPEGTSLASQVSSFADGHREWIFVLMAVLIIVRLMAAFRRRFTFHLERRQLP